MSGKGVYDISDCENLVEKGEIQWPSANAQAGLLFAALSVKNWSCEMNKPSGFSGEVPNSCEGETQEDFGRQYSHSSDDNLEGTVWYGANQEGSSSQMEPATARMVDISDPNSIKILDTVRQFPGHSMNWRRAADGREFIIGANEGVGSAADSCVECPRPVSLGNALDAYIVEVTGNKFGEPFPLTLDISGNQAVHVLMLQPQAIAALGLPPPTDPAYPYK